MGADSVLSSCERAKLAKEKMLATMPTRTASKRKSRGSLRRKDGSLKCAKTISQLEYFIAMYDDLTDEQIRKERGQRAWFPPRPFIQEMLKEHLTQRDRVELIIASYAAEHGGNAPSWYVVAYVLKVSYVAAVLYATQLTTGEYPRAVKKGSEFWLIESEYSHPLIRKGRT